MNIFACEYFTSGMGDRKADLQQAGMAMLNALTADLLKVPGVQLTTMLDISVQDQFSCPTSREIQIRWRKPHLDGLIQFRDTLSCCDAVVIIAPESNGILAGLTAIAEQSGKTVLGSSSHALELISHKGKLLERLKLHGVSVPQTVTIPRPFSENTAEWILARFSFPFVIKPTYGTGGEEVWLIENERQLSQVFNHISLQEEKAYLAQEYISGQAVSISCYVLDGQILPISLNKQIINAEGELSFRGITVPYAHPLSPAIWALAKHACRSISGLKGFIGIDMVINDPRGPVLIEMNGRFTMAYPALRNVVNRNLAQDFLTVCLENKLPDRPEISGSYTYYLN